MGEAYRPRGKKYWISRRDGLTERDAATGECRRIGGGPADLAYRGERDAATGECRRIGGGPADLAYRGERGAAGGEEEVRRPGRGRPRGTLNPQVPAPRIQNPPNGARPAPVQNARADGPGKAAAFKEEARPGTPPDLPAPLPERAKRAGKLRFKAGERPAGAAAAAAETTGSVETLRTRTAADVPGAPPTRPGRATRPPPPAEARNAGAFSLQRERTQKADSPSDAPAGTAEEAPRAQRLRFTDEERPPLSPKERAEQAGRRRRVQRAEQRLDRVQGRLEDARGKVPKKHTPALAREFRPEEGRAVYRLRLRESERAPGAPRHPVLGAPVRAAKAVGAGAVRMAHRKLYREQNDNVGLEAAHAVENVAERAAVRLVGGAWRRHRTKPYRKAAKYERKLERAALQLRFRQEQELHPDWARGPVNRLVKKRRLKQQYRRQAREAARRAEQAARSSMTLAERVGRAAASSVRHAKRSAAIAAALLLFLLCVGCFQSCTAILGGGTAAVLAAYPADDTELRDADLLWTRLELDLKNTVATAREKYPGYDEYRVNADPIAHDPFVLAGYLSAVYERFRFTDVEDDIRALFSQQYRLTIRGETEIRYKTVHHTDQETGETRTEKVPYEFHILHVRVRARPFAELAEPKLRELDRMDRYEVYMETRGAHQRYGSPFNGPCAGRVLELYGWRNGPDGAAELHRGLDFSCAPGEPVLAVRDGTVEAAGGYLVLSDEQGRTVRYAHCGELLARPGGSVRQGDVIARAGTRLHLEIEEDGESLNPYFLIEMTEQSGGTDGPDHGGDAGEALSGSAFEALRAEGERYLGFPYVWGGSSPSTSFDCSGFVCWVYTHSGVKSIPRTTAQGLYNQCVPVDSPRPGDLVFFTGTYDSPNPVTHVGVYAGGNRMLHAGDPIGYANINTAWWRSHFYAYGRIIQED